MAATHLRPRLCTNFSDSTTAADNLFWWHYKPQRLRNAFACTTYHPCMLTLMIPTNVLYNSFILRYCMSVFVNKRNFSKLILFKKMSSINTTYISTFGGTKKNLQHIHMSLYIRECSLSNTKIDKLLWSQGYMYSWL